MSNASPYDGLRLVNLRELLRERGLVTQGNKAELISRLVENDVSTLAASEPEAVVEEPPKPKKKAVRKAKAVVEEEWGFYFIKEALFEII